MSRYHLYEKRTRQKDGTVTKTWYYWYLGHDGSRVRRSTGASRKSEAVVFLEALELSDTAAVKVAAHSARQRKLRDVAAPLFLEGSAHLLRLAAKGKTMVPHTRLEHRRYIESYILPAFGDRFVDEITGPEIEDWLVGLSRSGESKRTLSNAVKNGIGRTFVLVLQEAKRAGALQVVPELELFQRNSRRKDVLLDAELELLFPQCPAALSLIWRRWPQGNRPAEPWEDGLLFGTLFAFSVSAGLRPGEGRATYLDQLYRKIGGMIVDRAFDNDENLGAPKKSRDNDPRYRVAYLPERTWKLLEYWIARRQEAEGNPGLLFPYRGHAITKHFLGSRFDVGLENAGISRVGRNLTPHSLRYTYDTKMRGILPGDVLREFIGHRSEAMTDHYDRATLRPVLEVRLSQLAGQKGAVERFWE